MNNVQWKKMKLGDVCHPSNEKYNPLSEHEFQFCVEMENINQESGTLNGRSDISKLLSLKSKFHKGDVLYGKLRPYLKKYWLADYDGVCSTEIWVFKNADFIDNQFLFYLFQSENINRIANLSSGTKMPRADWQFMAKQDVDIPFENGKPSLPTQRRIAAILSSADKVIEQTRQLISKYKSIKQGMMEDLLKPKEGWKKVKLGDCCITELGKTLDEGRNTGEYRPYLCALNVLWGKIDRTTIKQMRIEDDELNRYAVKKGDLLVCEGGEIGRCAIWDYDDTMYYQNALHRVRFFNGYDSMFFMYLLCYYNDLNLLEQHGKGLTIKHLNQTSFRSIPVSVPDLSEQRRIAKMLSGIDRKIEAEEKVLEKYEKMKKGLMERLLNE